MSTLRYQSLDGHVLHWDGELWSCPADGCVFVPTSDDAAARLHYWRQAELHRTVVVLDGERLDELVSDGQR